MFLDTEDVYYIDLSYVYYFLWTVYNVFALYTKLGIMADTN